MSNAFWLGAASRRRLMLTDCCCTHVINLFSLIVLFISKEDEADSISKDFGNTSELWFPPQVYFQEKEINNFRSLVSPGNQNDSKTKHSAINNLPGTTKYFHY